MADPNKPLAPPVTPGLGQDPEIMALQKALLINQLRNSELETIELQERAGIREDKVQRAKKQKETTKNTEKKRKAITNAEQASCPHMKPMNHGSAVAATRDHGGHVHFLCQYCQKTWDDSELPPNLRIPGEFIGGPHNTGVIF